MLPFRYKFTVKTGLRACKIQQTPTCTHNQSLTLLIPCLSICISKTFDGKALVNGSARFYEDVILVTTMSPLISISLIRW